MGIREGVLSQSFKILDNLDVAFCTKDKMDLLCAKKDEKLVNNIYGNWKLMLHLFESFISRDGFCLYELKL